MMNLKLVPASAGLTLVLARFGVTSVAAVLLQDLTLATLALGIAWLLWMRLLSQLSSRAQIFHQYGLNVDDTTRRRSFNLLNFLAEEMDLQITYATPARCQTDHWIGLFDAQSRELQRKYINQRGVVKLTVPAHRLDSSQYSIVIYERLGGVFGFNWSYPRCELRVAADGRKLWFRLGEVTMV